MLLSRGPYAHDTDGPMDRGPYSHAIPTLSLSAALLEVTATYAGLGPVVIDWGGGEDTETFTPNIGAVPHTYGSTGLKTVTMTDTASNTATASITL